MPTDKQLAKMCILINEREVPEKIWRGHIYYEFGCKSRKDLTVDDAIRFIDWLDTYEAQISPDIPF